MSGGPFHPSPVVRARILALFLDEIRRKAGYLALARATAAIGSPATLRRQAALLGAATSPILHGVIGTVAAYRALARSLGPHRALGAVHRAILAAARGVALPPPSGPDADALDVLAEALEVTLAAGQELDIYDVRWLDGPPGTVQLEILRCRLHEICHAEGAPEVTSCFCDAEVPVLTRSDPHLVLVRDMTIARGAPFCRFTFHVLGDLEAHRGTARASPPSS
jgi:hypothetical protein